MEPRISMATLHRPLCPLLLLMTLATLSYPPRGFVVKRSETEHSRELGLRQFHRGVVASCVCTVD